MGKDNLKGDDEFLGKLADVINRAQQPKLWDAQHIADYLGLKKSTVQSHIICKPTFPRAIKINSVRRWHPKEVMEWADKNREVA